MKHTGNNH